MDRLDLTAGGGLSLDLLARLALDASLHGQKLGTELLIDALVHICRAAEHTAGRLVVVDPVDPVDTEAAGFYAHHGFESVRDSTRMFAKLSSIRSATGFGG